MNKIDISDIQKAIYHCLFYLIREVEEIRIDWSLAKQKYDIKEKLPSYTEDSSIYKTYRRQIDESYIEDLTIFPETWGSTSLGFKGVIGGAAITTALTIIIVIQNIAYVYWGSSYAYSLNLSNKEDYERYIKTIKDRKSETV